MSVQLHGPNQNQQLPLGNQSPQQKKPAPEILKLVSPQLTKAETPVLSEIKAKPAPTTDATGPKVSSWSDRFFSIVSWVGRTKPIESLVKKAASGNFEVAINQNIKDLNELSGDEKLSIFVGHLAKTISKEIGDKDGGFVKGFVSDQQDFTTQLLHVILSKIFLNTGKTLKEKNPAEPVTLVNILGYLAESIKTDLKELHDSRKEFINNDIPGANEDILAIIENEAAEKLLRLAYPNGSGELPLKASLKEFVWNRIKDYLGPNLIKAAGYAEGLKQLPDASCLTAKPEKALLLTLTKEVRRAVTTWGDEFVANPEFAGLLAQKACAALEITDVDKATEMKEWLTAQIIESGISTNPAILELWDNLGIGAEKGMVHLFLNLATGIGENEDATNAILLKLMDVLDNFNKDKEKGAAIKETGDKFRAQNMIPEEQAEYCKHFESLALQLQKMTGLQVRPDVLPGFVNAKIAPFFQTTLPQMLAKQYEKHLVPLANLYQAILDPKAPATRTELESKPNGVALVRQCQRAGELITANGKQVLEVYQPLIVKAASEAIADEASGLKALTYSATSEALEEKALKTGEESGETSSVSLGHSESTAKEMTKTENMTVLKTGLASWLDSIITGIRTSNDHRIAKLWQFVGFTGEGLLEHAALEAGASKQNTRGNSIASIAISEKLLHILKDFISVNKADIDEVAVVAKKTPEDLELQKDFHKLFEPLAEKILALAGFQKGSKVFPEFLCSSFENVLTRQVSKILATQYESYLVPLSDLYETIVKTASKPEVEAADDIPPPPPPEEFDTAAAVVGSRSEIEGVDDIPPPPPLEEQEIPATSVASMPEVTTKEQCHQIATSIVDTTMRAVQANGSVIAQTITNKLLTAAKQPDLNVAANIIAVLSEESTSSPPSIVADATAPQQKMLQDWVNSKITAMITSTPPPAAQGEEVGTRNVNAISMSSLKASMSNILINLLEHTARIIPPNAPKNSLQSIFDGLLPILTNFMTQQSKELRTLYLQLPNKNKFDEILAQMSQRKPGENLPLVISSGQVSDAEIKVIENFVKSFEPLCKNLIEYIENELPIPTLLLTPIRNYLQTDAPAFFAGQYREFLSPEFLLAQSHAALLEVLSGEDVADREGLVTLVDNICMVIAGKIISGGESAVNEKLIKVIGVEVPVTAPLMQDNPYIYDAAKAFLMQAVTHYAQEVKKGGAKLNDKKALTSLLEKLATTVKDDLAAATKPIKAALAKSTLDERRQAVKVALTPMTAHLMELLKLKDTSIPFVNLNTLLPDLFADMCLEITALPMQAEDLREAMKTRLMGNVADFCSVFAQKLTDQVPAMLKKDNQKLVEKGVYSGIQKFFMASGNPQGLSVNEYLEKNKDSLNQMLCQLFLTTFGKDSPAMAFAKPLTKEYIEALLLKACNGITQRIDESENKDAKTTGAGTYQENFLINLGARLLLITTEHLETLHQVRTEANKSSILELEPETIIEALTAHSQQTLNDILGQTLLDPALEVHKEKIEATFDKMLPVVMNFIKKNRAKLQISYLQLSDKTKPDQNFITQFQPLCDELAKSIEKELLERGVPIPKDLLKLMEKSLQAKAASSFADNYREFNKLHLALWSKRFPDL